MVTRLQEENRKMANTIAAKQDQSPDGPCMLYWFILRLVNVITTIRPFYDVYFKLLRF